MTNTTPGQPNKSLITKTVAIILSSVVVVATITWLMTGSFGWAIGAAFIYSIVGAFVSMLIAFRLASRNEREKLRTGVNWRRHGAVFVVCIVTAILLFFLLISK